MIYLIADTHLKEEDIIQYERRPFDDANDMDNTIIYNWNHTVKPEDTVYVVGDFGANGCEAEILSKLNGTKYLIKGNHDTQTNEYYRQAGFEEVYDHPIIIDEFWILSHEPIYINESMPYANIFGHVHGNPMYKTYSRNHYCVSVERTGYKPVSFEYIKEKVKNAEQ